jgi:hypothetical protein
LIETARNRAAEEAASEREARERMATQVAEQFAAEAELRKQEAEQIRATALTGEPYQRPVAAPYASTPGEGRYVTSNIFGVPLSDLVKVVVLVTETESPIHKVDLFTRVAAMWGLRAGSRIQARILTACESAERGGITRRRGDFYWSASSDQKCPLRSRSGTKIPADRIADEEYQEAICAVLSEGHAFSLDHLTSEVRGVFGFSRTGAVLETAIKRVIEGLLREGRLGEGSTGIRLRN